MLCVGDQAADMFYQKSLNPTRSAKHSGRSCALLAVCHGGAHTGWDPMRISPQGPGSPVSSANAHESRCCLTSAAGPDCAAVLPSGSAPGLVGHSGGQPEIWVQKRSEERGIHGKPGCRVTWSGLRPTGPPCSRSLAASDPFLDPQETESDSLSPAPIPPVPSLPVASFPSHPVPTGHFEARWGPSLLAHCE